MIKFLSAYRTSLLLFLLVVLAYFALRLPNLTLQPIFADEAIYIRWAQVMRAEPTLRFLPLSDGKTPLFMWILMPLFKLFDNPLFAGRFLSTLAGFATLIGAGFLGWRFFNRLTAFWAIVLITIVPYIVFFDRMALVDSMLSAFSLWSLNIALLLIKYPRIDLAMVLGYFLGGGLLTKPPGFFSVLTLPITLIAFDWKNKLREKHLVRLFGLWLITIAITLAIYNILRLGPGFTSLSSRNQDYIFSPLDLVGRPLDPFIPHLKDLADWLPSLLTWPVVVSIAFSIIWAAIKKNFLAGVVILWAIVPLLIQLALLKTFTARYILFSFPPLLCLAAWGLSQIWEQIKIKKALAIILTLAIILPQSLYFDLLLLKDPALAPLPREERQGYLEDWTAGYGLKEIAQYLISESQKGVVVVGTEGSFGTLPDGLQIYLDEHSHTAPPTNQVIVIGGKATVSAQLKNSAQEHPTYFVANKNRYSIYDKDLILLKEYQKVTINNGSPNAILFFQLLPEKVR